MINLFTNDDIRTMSVTNVTPKCVRLSSKTGGVYFISHADFNLCMSQVPAYLMPVKKTWTNQYKTPVEVTFLVRMIRKPCGKMRTEE